MPTWHVEYPRPPPTAEEKAKEEEEKRQAVRNDPYGRRPKVEKPAPSPYIYKKHLCSLSSVVEEVNSVIGKAQALELKDFVDRAETATDPTPRQG